MQARLLKSIETGKYQKTMQMTKKGPSLVFCILMDILGYATYAIPVMGELADIVWAPISAIVFFISFGGWKGAFGGLFNFVEEILPGMDFIPTFTITWIWKYYAEKRMSGTARNYITSRR
jgi:hypothetical protein